MTASTAASAGMRGHGSVHVEPPPGREAVAALDDPRRVDGAESADDRLGGDPGAQLLPARIPGR